MKWRGMEGGGTDVYDSFGSGGRGEQGDAGSEMEFHHPATLRRNRSSCTSPLSPLAVSDQLICLRRAALFPCASLAIRTKAKASAAVLRIFTHHVRV